MTSVCPPPPNKITFWIKFQHRKFGEIQNSVHSTWKQLCSDQKVKIRNILMTLKCFLSLFKINPPPQYIKTTLLIVTIILCFLQIHINKAVNYVVCIHTLLFFITEQYSIVSIHYNFLVHWLMNISFKYCE